MRILLITPNFFDYPKLICDELKLMGHVVDWFDDRPSTNSFVKAIIRINKTLIHKIIAHYFENIMKTVKSRKYDKVLLVSGQSLSFTEKMILQLKAAQPQAEFVLYQWDSLRNFKYIETLETNFERCYSFDKRDVNVKENLRFLPLFYSRSYEEIGIKQKDCYKYDIMFVGTAHPKKYKYISEMAAMLKPVFEKQYIYFFFPSRIVYLYRKIKNHEFKNARYRDFHFVPLNENEMIKLLSESKCVLDSAQAGQEGLTIRVLEALGAKRKIITTNKDIVNYDFYREENVYVYAGKEFNLSSAFFTKPFREVDSEIYKKYSMRNWLNELLYGGGNTNASN